MPSHPPNANEFDALEFEFTDFSDARHALEEPPPGVVEVHRLRPGYWEERRRMALPTDRALAGPALDWLVHLPPDLRPRTLAEHYPRVVNRIAETWNNAQRCQATFEDLLADHRGGRQGFPFEAVVEMRGLRSYRARMLAR